MYKRVALGTERTEAGARLIGRGWNRSWEYIRLANRAGAKKCVEGLISRRW
jgi:hypothetical protein